jgi:hypothetical protein
VSLCVNEAKKTLSKYACPDAGNGSDNGAPLWICRKLTAKASLTLEAAVVIPAVAGFLAVLLMFFRVLEVETEIYSALSYAGRKTAAITTVAEDDAEELVLAEVYFREALAEYDAVSEYVRGGTYGVSLLSSDFSGDYVCLKANYKVVFPVGFFGVNGISVFQESKNRKWTGSTGSADDQDDWVYITETGSVYHSTRECRYLDLSIQSASYGQIESLRNKNQHQYYACALCGEEISVTQTVYITDYGTTYHTKLECSGLKRTIYQVQKSQVETMGGCSKCVGKENNERTV